MIGDVERVTEDISGRYLSFSYNVDNRLDKVTDNMGREVSFTYDANDDLDTYTDAENAYNDILI